MVKVVAYDLARMFKNPDNEVHINANRVAEAINKSIFNAPIITYHFFENKTIEQGEKIIFEILWLSVQNRIKLLKPEGAQKNRKDWMIQC